MECPRQILIAALVLEWPDPNNIVMIEVIKNPLKPTMTSRFCSPILNLTKFGALTYSSLKHAIP
jgi:hypothetical protein